MLITALTKLTLLDFPGRLACIIFTGGCNLRCGYCHNAEFVLPERMAALGKGLPFETVKKFLESRKGMLDGVVICGGEPTLQLDLMEKLREIKEMGFAVKLDTNGSNPLALKRIIEAGLVDFVDVGTKSMEQAKEILAAIQRIVGDPAVGNALRHSLTNLEATTEHLNTFIPKVTEMITNLDRLTGRLADMLDDGQVGGNIKTFSTNISQHILLFLYSVLVY
jgi:anaerobic ribonucleoside-triphosphate reductase activating protein